MRAWGQAPASLVRLRARPTPAGTVQVGKLLTWAPRGSPRPQPASPLGAGGVQPFGGCVGSRVGGLRGVATGQTLRLVLPRAAPAAFRGQIPRQTGMRSVVDALPSLEKWGKNHCPAKGAARRGAGCGALCVPLLRRWGAKEGAVVPFCPEPGRGCGGLGLGLGLEWKRQKELSDGWESHLGARRSCSGRAVMSKCARHPLLAPLCVGRG